MVHIETTTARECLRLLGMEDATILNILDELEKQLDQAEAEFIAAKDKADGLRALAAAAGLEESKAKYKVRGIMASIREAHHRLNKAGKKEKYR